MGLDSATNRNNYTGNDAVSVYAYSFKINNEDHLQVTVKDTDNNETTLTKTTDYTVDGVLSSSGGNVTLVNAAQDWLTAGGNLKTGYTLTIRRVVPLLQETDIRNQSDFHAETHEDAFDYSRMVDQQQQDEIDRSVKSPETLPASVFDPSLPDDVNTADYFMKVKSDATGFEMVPKTSSDIDNEDINADAGIEFSKMEALTADRALKTGGSGVVVPSDVTTTELEHLSGVTSNVQTQLDAKATSASLSSHTGDTANPHSTTKSHVGLGNVDNTSDATKNSAVATLTNKTIDDDLTFKEVATPSNPSAGYQKLFFDTSDNKPKRIDSAGNVQTLGGGGLGGFSLEADPYAQAGVGDWTLFHDTGLNQDMSGGAGNNVSFAADANSTDILSGDYKGAFELTVPASTNCDYEGVAKDYTIPAALQDRGFVYISGRYSSSTAFTTGDYVIQAYDVTNGENLVLRGVLDQELPGLSAGGTGYFTCVVYIPNDCASLRFGLMRAVSTTEASEQVVSFNALKINDQPLVDSAIISDWQDYTPTGSWTGNTTYTGKYRRVGDMMELQVKASFSGAPTPSASQLTVEIPSGLNLDYSKIETGVGSLHLCDGRIDVSDSSGSTIYMATPAIRSSGSGTTVEGFAPTDSGAAEDYTGLTDTYPVTLASGDAVVFRISVPIEEWANQSAVLSTTEMMNITAGAKAAKTSGSHTSTGNYQTVTSFSSAQFDDAGSFNESTGIWTARRKTKVIVVGGVGFAANATGVRGVKIMSNGSNEEANALFPNNGVVFELRVPIAAIVEVEKGDTLEIQAYQDSGGSLAYTGTANATVFSIVEHPSYSVYSVYGINEVLESRGNGATWPFGASVYGDLTSITLTPGTWDIQGNVTGYVNSSTGARTGLNVGILTVSGNSTTGAEAGRNFNYSAGDGNYPVFQNNILPFEVTVTEDTTYYLKARVDQTAFTEHLGYRIRARRIK